MLLAPPACTSSRRPLSKRQQQQLCSPPKTRHLLELIWKLIPFCHLSIYLVWPPCSNNVPGSTIAARAATGLHPPASNRLRLRPAEGSNSSSWTWTNRAQFIGGRSGGTPVWCSELSELQGDLQPSSDSRLNIEKSERVDPIVEVSSRRRRHRIQVTAACIVEMSSRRRRQRIQVTAARILQKGDREPGDIHSDALHTWLRYPAIIAKVRFLFLSRSLHYLPAPKLLRRLA